MQNFTLPAASRKALAETIAALEAEEAETPPAPGMATPAQEVMAKPDGYYAHASSEEVRAALRALNVTTSHALVRD